VGVGGLSRVDAVGLGTDGRLLGEVGRSLEVVDVTLGDDEAAAGTRAVGHHGELACLLDRRVGGAVDEAGEVAVVVPDPGDGLAGEGGQAVEGAAGLPGDVEVPVDPVAVDPEEQVLLGGDRHGAGLGPHLGDAERSAPVGARHSRPGPKPTARLTASVGVMPVASPARPTACGGHGRSAPSTRRSGGTRGLPSANTAGL
jgi:hypothetical protein